MLFPLFYVKMTRTKPVSTFLRKTGFMGKGAYRMEKSGLPAVQPVEIQMLGGFSIRRGDRIISETDGRSKKVWMLIEYLVANRKVEISQDKLIELLWDDAEEIDAPFNALKNLIYRARKQLKELAPAEKIEYIRFVRNTYAWNNETPTVVDVEQFEKLYREASSTEETDRRIMAYQGAIQLYQGEFLPKSSFTSWVIPKSAYYMSLYNECVQQVCILLKEQERYDEEIIICEKAVELYPFEEQIHKILLRAYLDAGLQSKAMGHYEYITELFYRELNVNISDSFRSLYREITSGGNSMEKDLTIIKRDLKEANESVGAFYCDYDVFKNFYRLQARSMMRIGQSIHVGLITLSDHNGDVPQERILRPAMDQLKSCIISSLRKGDVVSSYCEAQYVLILPMTTYENGEMVLKRILDKFHKTYRHDDVVVSTRLNAVDPA